MARSLPFALELLRTLAGDKAVDKGRRGHSAMILASQSPRRIELMREAGYDIRIIPADIDETPFDGEARLRSLNA
ncbi:MAG: Maf family protein [Collinsella aerofaciens]